MKTEELRIGNNVNRLGNKAEITAIQVNSDGLGFISTKVSGVVTINQIEPIPLSEEWLLKTNLQKSTNKKELSFEIGIHNSIFSGLIIVKYNSFVGLFEIKIGKVNIRFVEYLHDLQNFFYSLTGTELTIKK